jgi:hypothetical protein
MAFSLKSLPLKDIFDQRLLNIPLFSIPNHPFTTRRGSRFSFAPLAFCVPCRYARCMTHQVHIIGGGLAGSEAAWQLGGGGH